MKKAVITKVELIKVRQNGIWEQKLLVTYESGVKRQYIPHIPPKTVKTFLGKDWVMAVQRMRDKRDKMAA